MGKSQLKYVFVALFEGRDDSITVYNNSTLDCRTIKVVPQFLAERIALLKMCEVNTRDKGETIGRKLANNHIVVYLSQEEHKSICQLNGVKDEKST